MNSYKKTEILKRRLSDAKDLAKTFREDCERLAAENGDLKRKLQSYEDERAELLELKEQYESCLEELLDIKYKYQAAAKELADINRENAKGFNSLMRSLKRTVKKENR